MSERPQQPSAASAAANADNVDEALHRMSKKPGVKGWLMLDRADGTLIKHSSQIATVRPARLSSAAAGGSNGLGGDSAPNNDLPMSPTVASGSFSSDIGSGTTPGAGAANDDAQAAKELAGLVWSLVSVAGKMVDDVDEEDEIKLLRLRTKRQEFVVVVEPKYLLILIHHTPPI
ncbi:hypothetical protein GGS23DRAFT_548901 [Durotheca rogersii]|uniref:uncharacterized protein n=1 Tax=Durotheca rogersii TaxID=419775 RepID=UPI0022209F71|nr:uncharacterized protein GGS23DRAFT_548901 [Durotheca rogersii]KAI5867572.1 hypothetical protein GGS23DRAFT_548901 [Durotheca rogersii]